MAFSTVNPATGQILQEYKTIDKSEALRIAAAVHNASSSWGSLPITDRVIHVKKLVAILKKNKERYGKAITLEMGKPITQATAEVEKCAWLAEYISENAEQLLQQEIIKTDAKKSLVRFDPLGTILCIMPWNFPFWQALRFGIPAMLAGNTIVLRHSNVCPESALLIEQAFKEAEFPDNIFRTIITDHSAIPALIKSKYIQGVSLTGSTNAGIIVGKMAMKHLKKAVLELGGSDPFIILEDAGVKMAAQCATTARFINSGQSCIAAKRFIVVKSRAEEFTDLFTRNVQAQKVGDPLDPGTQIGPLVGEKQLTEIEAQVADAVRKGGNIRTGGKRIQRPGFFYEPTVITNTRPSMRIVRDEVFGPVAPIIVAKDEEHAIKIANNSIYGLGASIWTNDRERGERLAARLEAGCVFINNSVKSDPRMPFGGVKRSGLGRELGSFGIKEFVNIKGVTIY